MKIVLVKAWANGFEFGSSHMIGLANIAAYLEKYNYTVLILDAFFKGWTEQELNEQIRATNADVFGITAMTHEMTKVFKISS